MALILPIAARSLRQEEETCSEIPEVNPVAWQEVGRRIAVAFSQAVAEDDSDDEWMPCAEPEPEVTPVAAEDAAWAQVGSRLAGAFAAAIASGDWEEEDDWEAPRSAAVGAPYPVAVESGCGGMGMVAKGASPAGEAQATPATLPSTAPGTTAPSEVEPSEAASDSEEADGTAIGAGSPAFSALLSLRLQDICVHQPEQRFIDASGDNRGNADVESTDCIDVAREDAAFHGLCRRIAKVFEDASDSEEE
mmetsp:Transcript_101060/g.253441  ORF Transcript_101060/g.253441 Transcript_101060/m.253441 type:complete len:249 (-) Transcript_101060:288-1034(-)